MASAPSNDSVFYAGGHFTFAMSVTKTTDGGTNWTRYILPPMVNFTKALAVDPTNANIVYAGGDSVLYKTTNGGTTWTSVFAGLRGAVVALAVSFRTSSEVYAGTQYGLYKSTDGGGTWSSAGLSNVTSIAVDYANPYYIYAGTTSGVFRSTNNGTTWSAMNQGLLDSSITCLDIQSNQVLYAGTAAAGISGWALVDVKEEPSQATGASFRVLTSPVRGPAVITYSIAVRGDVRLAVYDAQGRAVKVLASGTRTPGEYRLVWAGLDNRGQAVPSGIYFCQFSSRGAKTVEKLVFLK